LSTNISASKTHALDLRETYLILAGDGGAEEVVGDKAFWAALASGERQMEGRLVMLGELQSDITRWEMHPAGEELLFLVSGAVDVVMERDGEEWSRPLEAGQACVVPRGAWHRVRVHTPGQMLFVTYGEGTEHRPL
jgi:mannose-6-phosphate isomerase-like protein (cupin superfamily)